MAAGLLEVVRQLQRHGRIWSTTMLNLRHLSRLCGVVVISTIALSSYQPAGATALKAPFAVSVGDGIVLDVRSGRKYRRHHRGGHRYWRKRRYKGKRYHRKGRYYGRPYYYRPYYGGYYGGGFGIGIVSGLIIGSAIASAPRRDYYEYDDGYSNAHYRWCRNRYKSYNARNNTWVAYSGRINQCDSPYD